jgi:hypothetical protein
MRRPSFLFLLGTFAWTLACAGGKDGAPGLFEDHDKDGDGFVWKDDCDDDDARVNPDAQEVCDPFDVDEDCDGKADSLDDDASGRIIAHHDADGDGYGAAEDTRLCELVDGYVTDDADCDDGDSAVNPEGREVCGGGDEDCDGDVDDADPSVAPDGFVDRWEDADGDGWGGDPTTAGCGVEDGVVIQAGDCDDADDAAHPDGTEVCGGGDEDCDGDVDENDAADATLWYADTDDDGFGDTSVPRTACDAPRGYVADDTDCDDGDDATFPGADETCNDLDDDCDGDVDEDTVGTPRWYPDDDGDGYGAPTGFAQACDRPAGFVSVGSDCDDADSAINPAATERCDAANTDEDCDGNADDYDASTALSGRTAYYIDDDSDGYGDPSTTYLLCDPHSDYVTDDTDCDDGEPTAHPGATEVCDSGDVDEDCDGDPDDADASVDPATLTTWYGDADRDSYGLATVHIDRCDAPAGYVARSTDCDDTDPLRNPGRTEVCDTSDRDEDCDGLADDADTSTASSGMTTYYVDTDADGYGSPSSYSDRCDALVGYVADDTDCDDGDDAVNPGAAEVCFDAVDDDCDGSTRCEIGTADAVASFYGDDRYSGVAGDAVAAAGDVDGDGIDDLLVGAIWDSEAGSRAGKAYLALGGANAGVYLRTDARATWRGENANTYAGSAVAGPGDLTGDGVPDVLVGVSRDNDTALTEGAAFVFSGATAGRVQISSATAWAELDGEGPSNLAGDAVAATGDVDGDGSPDLLVGAPGFSTNEGAAYLFTRVSAGAASLATASAIWTGESADDAAGMAVAGAGDTDGDGYDDLIVGAAGEDDAAPSAGAAYVILGPTTGTTSLASADAKLLGTARDARAGAVVAGGGDVDGDGYDDVLVGAAGAGTYGVAYLVLGPVASGSLSAADAQLAGIDGGMGSAVAVAGDLDGDGFADVAAGNESGASGTGAVSIFLGPVSGTLDENDADSYIAGSVTYDYLGSSLAYIGAQDGATDHQDLLVGALGDDTAGSASGAVYVFSSAP